MRHFPGLRKVRQIVFLRCGKLPPGRGTLVRRCVADSGYFLLWRPGFGARRHRRRIRHGRRCEPEHGRAGDRRQLKLCRMNLCRWCGRFLASHPDPGDRRARRPSRTRWIEQSDPRLACPTLRCGKQGIKTAANHLTRGTPAWEFSCSGDAMAFPRQSNRSMPNVAKNKTLRDRAFREIACREIAW
jgi:hypothetical protein